MEDDTRRRMTETYIAEHLWFGVSAIYALVGGELQTPRYTDMIDPHGSQTDNRTAEQIKADIVRKLRA